MVKWCLILASRSFMTGRRAGAGLRGDECPPSEELEYVEVMAVG
jgi:hypothetical protein